MITEKSGKEEAYSISAFCVSVLNSEIIFEKTVRSIRNNISEMSDSEINADKEPGIFFFCSLLLSGFAARYKEKPTINGKNRRKT